MLIIRRVGIFVFLIALTAGCRDDQTKDAEILKQIVSAESSSDTDSPQEIRRQLIDGEVYFYVPPRCCDIFGALYSASGEFVCNPDGGITGKGDGKCPELAGKLKEGELVWSLERDSSN